MQGRRAIREDQKQQRRQALIDVAWQLLHEHAYADITMTAVAEQASLAKGTAYLYFASKEELFLAVQKQLFDRWFDAIDAGLISTSRPCTVDRITAVLADTLAQQPTFVRLLAILHTTLEHNINEDVAVSFKHMLVTRLHRTGHLLEQCLPALGQGGGGAALLQAYALVIGLQHLASPAPVVRALLQRAEFAVFDVDFHPTFVTALRALLTGLIHLENLHVEES